MNNHEIIRIENKQGGESLLYSHDDGFTRYKVIITAELKWECYINESRCFKRGTHELIAKLSGFNLNDMESANYFGT